MSVPSFPLQWPPGFPRSKRRERSRFRVDYDTALRNVVKSLRLFASESGKKIDDPVLSSNINALDPGRTLTDPGTAVWFSWDGIQICIAVDRYERPAENLQAIHHILEARRTELRHGTLHLVRATFVGFKSLPAPKGKHWKDILGLRGDHITRDAIEAAFRKKAAVEHPDAGGSHGGMAELNEARTTALQEVG